MMITTPRCRTPVRPYEQCRYPDAAPELFPVCWRPAGHPGDKHRSRASYERELGKHQHLRRHARAVLAAEMTVPGDRHGS